MADSPAVTDKVLRMSYRIARGEQGVLTFEPYKSFLLPLWRFRTPPIAKKSARDLWSQFEKYGKTGDFVGMDMTRKYIQMGMTRAKRYANHKGGRKYDKETGEELAKSTGHKDMESKLEASNIFREYWLRCREHEVYNSLKDDFQKEQKEWDKEQKSLKVKGEDEDGLDTAVKVENQSEDSKRPSKRSRASRVKKEESDED